MHSGMYEFQESVRQMRGTAAAEIPDAKISVCHGVGGMSAASGTIIMSNEAPLVAEMDQLANDTYRVLPI
jgi:hypothetical protein